MFRKETYYNNITIWLKYVEIHVIILFKLWVCDIPEVNIKSLNNERGGSRFGFRS